jgi:peptidoglycan/LPS O-acetylase OafA/YrhL
LPALDGLRAISVFLVMLTHAGYGDWGSTGVNAFFVLSGFLITHLLLKEQESTGTIGLRAFYLRRSLRIFPAYYIFLIFSLTVDHFQGDLRSKDDAVASFLYLQNYRNAIVGHSNSSIAHSWSLGVEEQFYLLWPAAFLLLARRGHRTTFWALIAAIATVLAWRCFAHGVLGFSVSWLYNAFDSRFDSLATGCLLAVALRSGKVRSVAERGSANPVFPLITIALILLPFFIAPRGWKHTVGFTYEALLVAILVAQLMLLSQRSVWRFMEWRWLAFIGTLSYSLYLYHGWGGGVGDNFVSLPKFLQFWIGAVVALGLAYGSYAMVERPFLELKSRLGHRHLRNMHPG